MADILIVEDNEEIGILLQDFFTVEGYDVYHALSGEEALSIFEEDGAKVVILDIMLPGVDGFEVCRRIRENSDVPILIVSAKGTKDDKMNGLILGADDYIVKPFSMMEMVSRVKAVLRRSQPQQVSKLLKVGGLVVNLDEHTVVVDGNRVQLTYKEFELLRMFLSHPGMVYTREQLFSQVWKLDYMGDSRTLDSHIRTLRQKLNGYGKMIETVRNVGYRWEVGYEK